MLMQHTDAVMKTVIIVNPMVSVVSFMHPGRTADCLHTPSARYTITPILSRDLKTETEKEGVPYLGYPFH